MKFSKFKKNFTRKAVLFGLSDESQSQFTQWCVDNGFDLTVSFSGNTQKISDFNHHITLICSDNEGYIEDRVVKIPPITIPLIKFEVLGKDKNVPVIITGKTDTMLRQRSFFDDFYGLRDNWPEWKTHISLSYNWQGTPNLESLQLPDFPVVLDHITVDKLA